MRGHSHDQDLDPEAALRPKADRIEVEEADTPSPATLPGGRLDLLGTAGILGLQRAVGNAGVAALIEEERVEDERVEEERSPVLDVVGSGGGRPLDPSTRSDMESRFGADFGEVRVHTGDAAQASTAAVHAQAYTVGSDIVFADRQYAPDTPQGQHMLAHELAHVVQQRSGPVDGTDAGGGVAVSDPGDRFEREAAAVADTVLQRQATDDELLELEQ